MPTAVYPSALIIGASSGVGAALAKRLSREGYALGLVARRIERLEALRAELSTPAFVYQHDVLNTAEVPALLQAILADLGQIDLFVYNSGIMFPNNPTVYHADQDQLVLQVNLVGAVAWLNPVAQYFQQRRHGHIVGIGSIAGDRGRRGLPAYTASKAGLHTYLEGMRNRLWSSGVSVTTIKLGQVDTDMLQNADRRRHPIAPNQAAELIWRAVAQRKNTVYVPRWWMFVGLAVRLMPGFVFRHLSI